MFQKPKIHRIKPDIKNASVYLRSTKKWGKSTLFRDVILEKYGDPSYGLMVKCGHETGDTMLDEINSVSVSTWDELVELKDWLISEKGKEHNIEIVAFDTVDELVPMADAKTVKIAKKAEPTKTIKSIKGAFGGYGAGAEYSCNTLIKPYMSELKNHFGLWAIAHTKFKTIKEKGGLDEDGYMQLTSNLASNYESAFGDIFDVTLTGVIDREKDVVEAKDFNGNTIKKGFLKNMDTVRKLYFRGTTLIDAGGRFSDNSVPEYMVFESGVNNAAEFIRIFEEGMEKSKLKYRNTTPAAKAEPKIVRETPAAEPEPEELEDLEELMEDEPEERNTPQPEADIENPFEGVEDGDVDGARTEIKRLYKACTDKAAKSEASKIIKASGSINSIEWDELVRLFKILN